MLVSEVMLQQTQVSRVVPAWERFMERFPAPAELARASLADAVREWKGLGYNRRAAALWRSAAVLLAEHGGAVPSDPAVLRRLPGVGSYTAAAVAACSFGVPVVAMDTNVRRVVARARLGVEPIDTRPPAIAAAAEAWLDRGDPGAWNQAVMDLGRELCRSLPACASCPLQSGCHFAAGASHSGSPPGPRRRLVRPQAPFAGSARQLRGRIVDALRETPSLTLGELAARWGEALERVAAAVTGLDRDGLVQADEEARNGRSTGCVRLASGAGALAPGQDRGAPGRHLEPSRRPSQQAAVP